MCAFFARSFFIAEQASCQAERVARAKPYTHMQRRAGLCDK